jgi:hypothetical protein
MASPLHLAWMTVYGVLGSPPVMGKAPKAMLDSGEAPGTVGLAR